jgi:reactive intermediate/imine deaminase
MPYPFSTAVRVGDVWELSGQIGWDSQSNALVPGGVGPETRQALANIRQVLDELGSSMDDVIKVSVFLKTMDDFEVMNEEYGAAFAEGSYPARSAVAVAGLALGASVEIECSALAAKS